MNRSRGCLGLALLLLASWAQALQLQGYTPAALAAAQQSGQAVALHFHADWCPTCREQSRIMHGMLDDKTVPITVLVANYDTETALKRKLGVYAQATLIVYRGNQEKARLVAQTDPAVIRKALQAAQ